jgi:hypothetical protein
VATWLPPLGTKRELLAGFAGAFSYLACILLNKNKNKRRGVNLPPSARGINNGSVTNRFLMKNMIKDFRSEIKFQADR